MMSGLHGADSQRGGIARRWLAVRLWPIQAGHCRSQVSLVLVGRTDDCADCAGLPDGLELIDGLERAATKRPTLPRMIRSRRLHSVDGIGASYRRAKPLLQLLLSRKVLQQLCGVLAPLGLQLCGMSSGPLHLDILEKLFGHARGLLGSSGLPWLRCRIQLPIAIHIFKFKGQWPQPLRVANYSVLQDLGVIAVIALLAAVPDTMGECGVVLLHSVRPCHCYAYRLPLLPLKIWICLLVLST